MASTSPFTFLQPTARTILMPAPVGGGLPPGTIVGNWRLVSSGHRLAKRTRQAAVHRETGQQVVIELFDAPVLLHGDYTNRMRDALAALLRIEHLGAPVHCDVGMLVDGRPYVVREAIDGYALDELRAEGPLSDRALINIVRGVCELVLVAHAAEIPHGVLDLEQLVVRASDATIVLLDWRITNVIAEEALRCGHVITTSASQHQRLHSDAADVFDIGMMILQLMGDDVSLALESLAFAMCADDPDVRPTLEVVLQRLAAAEQALDAPKPHAVGSAPDVSSLTAALAPRSAKARGWRLSSLALACVAPTLVLAWHDNQPLVAANITPPTIDEPVAAPQPMPMPSPVARPVQIAAARPAAVPAPVLVRVPVAKPAAAHVKTVEKPVVAHVKSVANPVSSDGAFLREYQRVGHDLLELENSIGSLRAADLRTAFRAIHLDAATQSSALRHDAMLALADIERRIERLRPVEITGACKDNPLADGCQ